MFPAEFEIDDVDSVDEDKPAPSNEITLIRNNDYIQSTSDFSWEDEESDCESVQSIYFSE